MIRRPAVVIPDSDVVVPKYAKLPQIGVRRRGDDVLTPIVDAVVIAVATEDLVRDMGLEEVVSVVGDVAHFDRRVAPDLVLEHGVPLPVVRRPLVHVAAARRRAERCAEAAITWFGGRIELTNAVQRADERRVRGDAEHGAEPLAQGEVSEAGTERCLALSRNIPRHTKARRDVV